MTEQWQQVLDEVPSLAMPRVLREALEQLRFEIALGDALRARLSRPLRGPRRINLPAAIVGDRRVRLFFTRDGRTAYERGLTEVTITDLVFCHPVRDFSRRHGQSHKPKAHYSHTVGDHIACESQHESRFVTLADWHPNVVHIAAQPFTIVFEHGHEFASHTPDFAIILRDGLIVIVDVKWPSRAFEEATVRRHEAVGAVLAKAAMQHVVFVDEARVVTDNLANFAGARVPQAMLGELAPKLLALARSPIPVSRLLELGTSVHQIPHRISLVVVRRLLWERQLTCALNTPFRLESEVVTA